MKPTVYRRMDCRLCSSADLTLALKLAPSPIADDYIPKERLPETQPLYPLDLYLCGSCAHLQMLDIVPPEILFKNYIYVSTGSTDLTRHFQQYSQNLMERRMAQAGDLVLDIGSNDGTLLRCFKEKGMRVLGVDPAQSIAGQATASGIETIPAFFTSAFAESLKAKYGSARIITANNVYAHADDLGNLTDGIRQMLAPDGVFVFEVSYLRDLMDGMVFDSIYHEHLSYHTVKPLKGFFKQHGLELIDVERIPTKGGSIRGFAQHIGGPRKMAPAVEDMVRAEEDHGFGSLSLYTAFAQRIDAAKSRLLKELSALRSKGKVIAGFGASATSTTLIYHFGLGDQLPWIFDDNSRRHGLYSPGYHIPVLSPAELATRKPDYLVMMAWRFARPIIERNRPYLESGGHFIIPLPKFEVI